MQKFKKNKKKKEGEKKTKAVNPEHFQAGRSESARHTAAAHAVNLLANEGDEI